MNNEVKTEPTAPGSQLLAKPLVAVPRLARIVALGYYDGPTSGVAKSDQGEAEYRFEMIDWDNNQDVRVFSLAPLPPGSFDEIVDACRELHPPRWPVWVPLWKFPSESLQKAAEERIEQVLRRAGPPEWIVAWTEDARMILAARRPAAGDIPDVRDWFSLEHPGKARDWFVFLGLDREPIEDAAPSR